MDYLTIELQVLNDQQLFEKVSKCEYWLRSTALLGNIFSSECIEIYSKKTNTVKSWHRLVTPSNIRSLLSLVGYYRRFVEGFSSIASPLMVLTQNKSMFVWSDL